MRAILSIFVMALIAFGIHFAAFALIPAARGPTVRVSHAVLGIAGNVLVIIISPNPIPRESILAALSMPTRWDKAS